jgi:hypothetical protein
VRRRDLIGAVVADLILVLTALGAMSLTTAVAYAQRVGYPLMTLVPAEQFEQYESMHLARIWPVVAFGFTASGVGSLALPFLGLPPALFIASLLCFGGVGITSLGAVAAHGRLRHEFDAAVHQRLMTWNRWRLVFGICHTAVLVALLLV